MKNQTIEEQWQGYATAVEIPLGGTQWREMRRAFYAGAVAILRELSGFDGPDDDGIRMLEAFEKEAYAFFQRIQEGKA